jgi:transketolase
MPCREWFDARTQATATVLPPAVRARVVVEAAVAQGWRELVGDAGRCVSLEHYGASADYKTSTRSSAHPEAVVAAAP